MLVIDDDPDIAALVGLRMQLDGHEVEIAHDGADGLARALESRPDLVIVDWTLPGLTGPEVCARLREAVSSQEMWLVMLTARPLTDAERRTTCADDLIAKPFSPRALSQRVSAALARERPITK